MSVALCQPTRAPKGGTAGKIELQLRPLYTRIQPFSIGILNQKLVSFHFAFRQVACTNIPVMASINAAASSVVRSTQGQSFSSRSTTSQSSSMRRRPKPEFTGEMSAMRTEPII